MFNQKVALFTDQDGASLTEFLLETEYVGTGIKRRVFQYHIERIDYLYHDPQNKDQQRVYKASTSMLFGLIREAAIRENTLLSLHAICCRQAVWLQDNCKLL